MARFSADQAEHYGGQGGGGFFGLVKNHQIGHIRFLYNGIDDVVGDSVHQIEINGKKRWVACLRNYKDPKDVCPFCREGKVPSAKVFIPVYNIDEDKTQVWERGKTFFGKITGICNRYKDLVSHTFEVERNGEPNDPQTTYEIYETGSDDTVLEDFEMPNIYGESGAVVVLEKSADDMEYYLTEGCFPPTGDEPEQTPIRRRESNREESRRDSGRRTPARNNSEAF